jgi:tetratricopeptide (TPR) repeat protein
MDITPDSEKAIPTISSSEAAKEASLENQLDTPPGPSAEAPVEMAPAVIEEPSTEAPVEAYPAVMEEAPADAPVEVPPPAMEEPPSEIPPQRAAEPQPAARRRSPLIWIIGGVVLILILAAAGGFIWLRSSESASLKQAQDDLQAANWAAAETAADQGLQYRSTGLLANPAALVLARGEARYHLGKSDLAMADLEEGKAADPAAAKPYLLQAQIKYEQGNLGDALSYAGEAQKRDDKLGFPHALQALQAYQQRDYTQALTLAGKAIDRDASIAISQRIRGSILSIQGSYPAAVESLSRALELQPDDVEALAWRAYAYLQSDKKELALKDAGAANSAAPESAAGLWAQAMMSYINYKNDDSLAAINKAIAIDADRPEFYYLRATSYYKTANRLDVLADYDKTLQLAPDFVESIFSRAWDLYSTYQEVDIEAEANRILKINPQSGLSSRLFAYQAERQRDWEKALAYYEQARSADAEDFHVYYDRGYAYFEMHEYTKASEDCDQALEIWPGATGALLCLADIQYAQKNYDQALENINQALQLNPQNAGAHAFKAAALMGKQDNMGAKAEVDAALKIDPQHSSALRFHASLAMADDDSMQAISDLNKALDAYPNNPMVILDRGHIYLDEGNTDRALQDAQAVLKIDKYLPETQYLLFTINMDLDKKPDALQNAKTAAELDPNSSLPYLFMGEVYQSSGNNELAITNLQMSIKIAPDDIRAYYFLELAHEDTGDYEAAANDYRNLLQYKDLLTEDEISRYQAWLDFLVTIPKAINGERTVVNEDYNFTITYPVAWRQQPNANENYDLTLAKIDEKQVIVSSLLVSVQPYEPGSPDASITTTYIADLTNQILAANQSFKFISRKPFEAKNIKGIVDTFEMDQSNEDGSTSPVSFQVYYFKNESEFLTIMLISMRDSFATNAKEADEIVATLTTGAAPPQ